MAGSMVRAADRLPAGKGNPGVGLRIRITPRVVAVRVVIASRQKTGTREDE